MVKKVAQDQPGSGGEGGQCQLWGWRGTWSALEQPCCAWLATKGQRQFTQCMRNAGRGAVTVRCAQAARETVHEHVLPLLHTNRAHSKTCSPPSLVSRESKLSPSQAQVRLRASRPALAAVATTRERTSWLGRRGGEEEGEWSW